MQITVTINDMTSEALLEFGYALYKDVAERNESLLPIKAIINELNYRGTIGGADTSELEEMVAHTEARRTRRAKQDALMPKLRQRRARDDASKAERHAYGRPPATDDEPIDTDGDSTKGHRC